QINSTTICANAPAFIPFFTSPAGTIVNWVNSNTAIGLPASGSGDLNFTTANVQSAETGILTATPVFGGCAGTPIDFPITVVPLPILDDPADVTVCAEEQVTVNFTGNEPFATFEWTNSNPAIGLPASGTGDLNFMAANVSTPQTATITVEMVLNFCTSLPQTFTITVNPRPQVNQPANVTVCQSTPIAVNFTGTPGATFSWTNSNPAIGLPANGSGNLNFVAGNVAFQEVGVITVTPVGPNGCPGTPVSFTITVNPGPEIDPVADESVCAGDFVGVVFSSPSGNPTYSWTNSNPAIGLPPVGAGNINFNGANVPTTQTGTITVTAALGGCIGTPETFTITVSPAPTMGQPANATACGGSTVNIAFAGSPGAVFEWTNSNPNIGLPANGTGNISFVTANPTVQEVATITVTPVIGGCQGPSRTFTITVNPAPEVFPQADLAVCGGDAIEVVFSSANNPVFNWTNSNTAIGLGAAGNGTISFTSAVVATPQTATITVTPTQNGCTGPTETFTIIVSPTPTVNPIADQITCGGLPTSFPLTGSAGATFNWVNSNPAIGLPASGSGNIFFPAANVSAPTVGTITVTPTVGSCVGASESFNITVNPAPSMTDPADLTVCAGVVVPVNFSGTPGATFSWTNTNTATGLPASGTGNIGFLAANLGTPETSVITVTPALGGCPGPAQMFLITVNPAPAVAPVANRDACAGDSILINFSGSPGATLTWSNSNPAIGLPAGGNGNLHFQAAQVAVPETATIIVTPGAAGAGACAGTDIVFTVTVRPGGGVDSIADLVACAGQLVEVNFTGPGNPDFVWSNSNPAIGLPAGGTGNISFNAANVTAVETAIITVAPDIASGFAYIPNNVSNDVSVIDLATNTVVATIPVGFAPFGVSVSPDGSRVYVTNREATGGTVSVIDAATNTVIATIPVGQNPTGIAVSPDGSLALVANSASGTVSLLETFTNTVLADIPTPGVVPSGVTFHPDGLRAYISGSNRVLVLDVIAGTITATIPVGGGAYGLRVSPDGSRIYVACAVTDNLYVLDAATNTVLAVIPVGDAPSGVVISPDGSRVYIANENDATVSVLDAATNTVVANIPISGLLSGPIGISITPDGQLVYVANILADEVTVISTVSNTEIAAIPVGLSPIAFGNFITPVSDCVGAPQTFTITVNPAPFVQTPADLTVCADEQVSVAFSGSAGATFSWTNDNPAIGLPASGAGNLDFPAAQVSVSETAVITVTPDTGGGGACPGVPVSFEITVNPVVGVNAPGDRTACVGDLVEVLFSAIGNPSAITWTNDNPAIGLPASGTGDISFTAANVATVQTATITVGAQAKGGYAYVASYDDAAVLVIDLDTNTPVDTIPVGSAPFGVSVHPDGSRVYVTNQSNPGQVYIIDTQTNTVINSIPTGDFPASIVISPDGSKAYVTLRAGTVNIIDLLSNSIIANVDAGAATADAYGIDISPDGSTVYVTMIAGGVNNSFVSIIDANSNTISSAVIVGNEPLGVAVSPDGSRVYTANRSAFSYSVSVIDAVNRTLIADIPVGNAPHGIVVSPDGSRIYVSNENSNDVTVIDAHTNTVITTFPNAGTGPTGISITPDGKWLYVVSLFGEMTVFDAQTGAVATTIPIGFSTISLGNFITAAATCAAPPQTFTITVGPTPTLVQPNDLAVCGETTVNLAFGASAGATVNWTNDNPAIGLPASGTGDLSFPAANVATPQTAIITATPVLGSCTGIPVNVQITINPGTSDTTLLSATTCDPAQVGAVVQDLTNLFGCDSIVVTTTTLLPADNVALSAATCDPGAAGVFVQNLVNQFGCDSIVTTTVVFDPAAIDSVSLAATTCDPAQVGVSVQNLTNQFGCDSIVTTTTTLLPADNVALSAATCDPGAAGVFVQNLVNQFGCDSIVTTTVVFDPAAIDSVSLAATTCDPAQVGVSVQNLTNQFGCDSIVTTTTTLLPSDAVSVAATTCDPAQVGVSVQNLSNQFGCDSIVTTTTTLLPSDAVSVSATTCDPAQVGVSVQNLTNQFGCDSIVTTTTTLLPSVAVSVSATTCDPAQVGVSVQNLSNQFGCDSIVTTTTTLLPSDAVSVSATTCNPAQVGVSVQNLTNQFGCDSIVTTTTTLLPSDAVSISATTCDPAMVGVTVQNLSNQFGCDSIVTTTTTLLPSDAVSVSATTCDPAQVGVSVQNLSNQFGCDSIVTTTTTLDVVGCAPVVSLSVVNPLCAAAATGSFAIQIQSGQPPYQYAWTNNLGNTGSGQITALSPPTVAGGLVAGTYTVTITNPANGVTGTASATLTAPPALVAAVAAPAPHNGYEISCAGASDGSAAASATGGTPQYQFSWSNSASGPALNNLGAGTYTLTATDANGCTATASATLNAPLPLVLNLELERGDCGDTLVDATVTATGGVGPYALSVDGNLVPGTMPGLNAGTHILAVTDANACEADSSVTVVLPPLPAIVLPPDTTVIIGNALHIEAVTNLGAWTGIVWQPLPDTACQACLAQEWTPESFQLITVTITDTFGCTASDQIRVGVKKVVELYVPNAFRPDRSGRNDTWTVNAGPSVLELQEVSIFDRWGDQQYLWNNPLPPNSWPGWDGTARGGLKANPGVYVYYLKVLLADGTTEVVKGDVTILE
ncbi:MAG: beta-propeller fold lactonase family protein, partial [Saprospiraceae bacterium]|nr:beta-propeller fold lactonase family protein [Saprospiraceae bacterium]